MSKILTRACFTPEEIEVRRDDGKPIMIRGYAAMFEKLSLPIYNFKEKIRAGAFKNSIAKNNIRALWNHNTDFVLGSTKSNTLRLEEDDRGLKFELLPPDTSAGRDAVVSIERGDVDGMSFGFRTLKQEWDESDKNNIIRTLVDVDLKEISATPFPAYPSTKVKVRSVDDDYSDYRNEYVSAIAEKNAADLKLKNQRLHEYELM